MQLKNIQEAKNLEGKKVLVRVDFNVGPDALENTEDHFKLSAAKETIDFLFAQGVSKVALMAHFGRPDGKRDEAYSLKQVIKAVSVALGRKIRFVDDCIGEDVAEVMKSIEGEALLLLENLRFYTQEESNDTEFAKRLAEPFDMYVNDAFSVCHRAHASVAAVTGFLESYAGLRLIEEVKHLEILQTDPMHPAVAVIGGSKIETKLPIIRNFEKFYDAVLVGGRIANEALDQHIDFSDKVFLPIDFQNKERFDIGTSTCRVFDSILSTARTIVWNGPMGKFEEKPYDKGTNSVLEAITSNKDAYVVIGGGESLTAASNANALGSIGFVSTGGGAMLDFLGGAPMPGLTALTK